MSEEETKPVPLFQWRGKKYHSQDEFSKAISEFYAAPVTEETALDLLNKLVETVIINFNDDSNTKCTNGEFANTCSQTAIRMLKELGVWSKEREKP